MKHRAVYSAAAIPVVLSILATSVLFFITRSNGHFDYQVATFTLLGFFSCYVWLRLKFGEWPALVAACAWILNSSTVWRIVVGDTTFLSLLLLPLFLLAVEQLIIKPSVRSGAMLGTLIGLTALLIPSAGVNYVIVPATVLWTGVLLVRRYRSILKAPLLVHAAVAVVLASLIALPHLLAWSAVSSNQWIDDGTIAFDTAITYVLRTSTQLQDLPVSGDFAQTVYGIWEVNVALGLLATVLAIFGLVIGWWRNQSRRDEYIYMWTLLIVGMALATQFDLWTALDQFFSKSLTVAPRLLGLVNVGLVLGVAFATQRIIIWGKKIQWQIGLMLAAGVMIDAWVWLRGAGQIETPSTPPLQITITPTWLISAVALSLAAWLLIKGSPVWLQTVCDRLIQLLRRIKTALLHLKPMTDQELMVVLLVIACLAVVSVQLIILPNFGTLDTGSFVEVLRGLDSKGLLAGYSYKNLYYPPLASVLLYPLTWFATSVFAIKCLVATFYYAVVLMILFYLKVLKQQPWMQVLRTILIILGNAALIESVFVLGYIDILIVPALLLAFYSLARKHYFWAGAALAVAFMIKLLPILLLPAFLIWFYRQWKGLFIFCLGVVVVVLPQLLIFDQVALYNVIAISNAHGQIPSHAFNVNQIVALFSSEPTTSIQMYYIGRIMFVGSALLLLRKLLLSKQSIIQLCYTCSGIFLAYFVWFSGVHENHLFPALIPLLVVVLIQPNIRHWLWYHVITLLIFFNLFIPYGFGLHGDYLGLSYFWTLSPSQLVSITVIMSMTSVITYITFMWQALRR